MRFILLAILVATVVSDMHPVNKSIVEKIKTKTTSWTPMEPEENPFFYKTIDEVKRLASPISHDIDSSNKMKNENRTTKVQIPDSFDARVTWPEYIHPLINQQDWDSSHTIAAASSLSDRFAIWTKGDINIDLSSQYISSCLNEYTQCSLESQNTVWSFIRGYGTPSSKCFPYKSGGGESISCPSVCDDGSEISVYKAKYHDGIYFEEDVKDEILENGPLVMIMDVFEDLFNYKTGIYRYTTGELVGAQRLKGIGWGEDPVEGKYWILANSWGESWGEQGHIRIAIGDVSMDNYLTFFGIPLITTKISE